MILERAYRSYFPLEAYYSTLVHRSMGAISEREQVYICAWTYLLATTCMCHGHRLYTQEELHNMYSHQ